MLREQTRTSSHGTRGQRGRRCRPRPQTQVEAEYPCYEDRLTWYDHEVCWQTHALPEGVTGGGRNGRGVQKSAVADDGVDVPHWPDRLFRNRPANEYEALMACAPFEEPETHAEELLALREALADAIDALPPREREVFDGVFTRRETLQVLGDRLGYSRMHVSRIRNRAVQMLQVALIDVPSVSAYLSRANGSTHD